MKSIPYRFLLSAALCCEVAASRAPARSGTLDVEPRLYAGGPNANVVDRYPALQKDPNADGAIATGLVAPTGMAVDRMGNLYVCNNGGQAHGKSIYWTVTVYRRGQATPIRTYSDGVFSPVDIVVAGDGTAFIANYGSATVTIYPPNELHPSRTLVAPAGSAPVGLALDGAGDVFVSYDTQSSGVVYEYRRDQSAGKNVGIVFSGSPHGLAFDAAGNLIVAVSHAPSAGSTVDVYAPGATQPKARLTGTFQPFMVAFNRHERRLYVADYASGNNDGAVFEYSYPDGALLGKDARGAAAGAYGIVLDPAAAP